jgi:DNA-directed RNA polymerase subunit RPC12/RpoP
MTCTQCSTPNEPRANFCQYCGSKLSLFNAKENDNHEKTITLFVTYTGLVTIRPIAYFAIRYFGWNYAANTDSGYAALTQNINAVVFWILTLAEIIALIFTVKKLQRNPARVCLIIFICLQLWLLYFAKIFPLTV